MIRVAVAQFCPELANYAANAETVAAFAALAAERGCSLLLCPEASDFGFDLARAATDAQPHPSDFIRRLEDAAERSGVAFCVGIFEKQGSTLYNSQYYLPAKSTELPRCYRKAHLITAPEFNEKAYVSAGGSLSSFIHHSEPFGQSICFDLRFPEMYRAMSVAMDPLAFAVSSAWPRIRIEHWDALLQARAIENQTYVLAANACGMVGRTKYGGRSAIVAPDGGVIAKADDSSRDLLVAELDRAEVNRLRSSIPVLSVRRTDLY